MSENAPMTGVAWDGHHLAITSDEVLAKVDRAALSVSTAQSLARCPAAHVGDKLLPETPDPMRASNLGTAAHEVLEHFYQRPATQRDRRALSVIINDITPAYVKTHPTALTDPQALDQWKHEVFYRTSGIFDLEDPAEVHTTFTERRISGIEVGGVPFNGIVDRGSLGTFRKKTGLVADDFKAGMKVKTGKLDRWRCDEHGDQMRTYAEALRIADGERVVQARVLYTTLRHAVTVPLGPSFMKPTLARFAQAWKDLRRYVSDQAFPTKTSPLCGWCPLVNACPAAQAEGLTDRKGGALTAAQLAIEVLKTPDTTTLPATDVDDSWRPPLYTDDDAPPVDTPPDEGGTMPQRPWREAKPYEGAMVDGHLSLNSYSATAVFGTAELAVELLHEHSQPITGPTVKAMASALARIVLDAQHTVTFGDMDWQMGANTRVRGALRTTLRTMPPPFGQDLDAWQAWTDRCTRRCVSIARTAIDLFDNGPATDALEVLAGHTTDQAGGLKHAA